MKKLMIVALAGTLVGGVATSAQARGGIGHIGGVRVGGSVGMAGTNFGAARAGMAFHERAPATSTSCNLNPGYLYHPCF